MDIAHGTAVPCRLLDDIRATRNIASSTVLVLPFKVSSIPPTPLPSPTALPAYHTDVIFDSLTNDTTSNNQPLCTLALPPTTTILHEHRTYLTIPSMQLTLRAHSFNLRVIPQFFDYFITLHALTFIFFFFTCMVAAYPLVLYATLMSNTQHHTKQNCIFFSWLCARFRLSWQESLGILLFSGLLVSFVLHCPASLRSSRVSLVALRAVDLSALWSLDVLRLSPSSLLSVRLHSWCLLC